MFAAGWFAKALVFVLLLGCSRCAIAGALAPCVKAGSSANGDYLVIRDFQLESGAKVDSGQSFNPERIALQVYPRERFINQKDRLTSDSTFWTDLTLEWSVVIDLRKEPSVSACPNFLITNGGEFLVIFGGRFGDSALRIYRRRDHPGDPMREGEDHGVFIQEVSLKELWPAKAYDRWRSQSFTDESPQWFAGGSFVFKQDSRQLIYKTQWGNTARIQLADGSVIHQ
jgi:hypothetical protein